MKAPTRTQQQVLDFISGFIDANGFPPTYKEIATHFGYGSSNSVACHLDALERKGLIERGPSGHARALRVVNQSDRRVVLSEATAVHVRRIVHWASTTRCTCHGTNKCVTCSARVVLDVLDGTATQ